jgi:hypothetical protein
VLPTGTRVDRLDTPLTTDSAVPSSVRILVDCCFPVTKSKGYE